MSKKKYKFDSNIIVLKSGKNFLRLFNPQNRVNFFIKINFLETLFKIENKNYEEVINSFRKFKVKIYDSTEFSLILNAYQNSDMLSKNRKIISNHRDIFSYLLKNSFIYSGSKKFLKKRTNIFDRLKGNFNEQLNSEMLYRGFDIKKWWHDQKFKKLGEIKKTPYKFIQENFFKNYFKKNLKNKTALEIGCGNGHYSFLMSKNAKKVYGFDYEKDYISSAQDYKKKNKLKNVFFYKNKIEDFNFDIKFDYIFLIDVFLFFFDKKFQPNLTKTLAKFFKKLKSNLEENGKIVICDPHLFWLIPSFGNSNFPFGVITEYKKKFFSTSYTLSEVSNLFNDNGLKIQRIFEPEIDKKYFKIDKKMYKFFSQFPQWIVFEITK